MPDFSFFLRCNKVKVLLLFSSPFSHVSSCLWDLFPPLLFTACCSYSFRLQEVWRRHFLRLWTIWSVTINGGTRAWPYTCATPSRGRRPCWSSPTGHVNRSHRRSRCLYLKKNTTTRVRHIFYLSVFFSRHRLCTVVCLTFSPFPL